MGQLFSKKDEIEENKYENFVPIKNLYYEFSRNCSLCCSYIDNEDDRENNRVLFYPLHGWIFCNTCINNGNAKQNIIEWFRRDKIIPCNWMFANNTFKTTDTDNSSRCVKFCMDTIKEGTIADYNENKVISYSYERKTMQMHLNYLICATATYSSSTQYYIDLSNIIKHTDNFYKELVNCKNIMNHTKVIIAYNELPKFLRDEVERSRLQSNKM